MPTDRPNVLLIMTDQHRHDLMIRREISTKLPIPIELRYEETYGHRSLISLIQRKIISGEL